MKNILLFVAGIILALGLVAFTDPLVISIVGYEGTATTTPAEIFNSQDVYELVVTNDSSTISLKIDIDDVYVLTLSPGEVFELSPSLFTKLELYTASSTAAYRVVRNKTIFRSF